MTDILFVLNPIAGGGKAKEIEDIINTRMKVHNKDYDIIFTSKPLEAIDIVKNAKQKIVIAIGGDGTVNEVAEGLLKRGFGTMGIIPAGTGNDLSRSLNIPLDPKEAIEYAINNQPHDIDVCKVNDRYYFNIASIGFDAEVVERASRIKHIIKGEMAYFLSVLYTLFSYKKEKVIIEIDGEEIEKNLLLLAVGSGKYYGGGIKVMPDALVNDNNLHLCIISNLSKLKLLLLFPTIFKGKHVKYEKYVDIIKAKSINIKLQDTALYNIDGEILTTNDNLKFEITDKKIPVIYPKSIIN